MTNSAETKEPCAERCGVHPLGGRTTPLNPITAKDYLVLSGFLSNDGKSVDPDDFIVKAMECAEALYDGCALIRNKYLEAAKADDESAMYRLLVNQMAVIEEPVPFTVRAISGLRKEGLWGVFAQAVADELEYILQSEIEDELADEDEGELEEDDYVGMTE